MIELKDVRARGIPTRGEPTAELRGANARIDRGLTVLVGPRAGGGPLLLSLLAGSVAPHGGMLTIAGLRPGEPEARVAHVPLVCELPPSLKVKECVHIALNFREKSAEKGISTTTALGKLGIESLENRNTTTLTRGEHRAVLLAIAIACEPRVLLVDEPHASFDPRAQARVTALLRAFAEKDATVIVTTQSPRDAERLGGRVLRVENGLVTEAPARTERRAFLLACDRPKDLAAALATLASVETLRAAGSRVIVSGKDSRALARDIGALVAKNAFEISAFEPCDSLDLFDPAPNVASGAKP